MANEIIKIDLLGTIAITDWANEHPDYRFSYTEFRDKFERGYMMVSDVNPKDFSSSLECIERGLYQWHNMPNGWRRVMLGVGSWLLNKGDRYLFMDC